MSAADMTADAVDALLLFGVEPGADMASVDDAGHGFIAACTPFASREMKETADLLLPIGTFAETSGTYVNGEGRWQSFGGVANPVGEARPGWKVLRVLGNLLDAEGFDYETSEDVRDEIHAAVGDAELSTSYAGTGAIAKPNGLNDAVDNLDVPMYRVDALVRRAHALQLTPEARRANGGGE